MERRGRYAGRVSGRDRGRDGRWIQEVKWQSWRGDDAAQHRSRTGAEVIRARFVWPADRNDMWHGPNGLPADHRSCRVGMGPITASVFKYATLAERRIFDVPCRMAFIGS